MATSSIKGITLVIGANTDTLQNALQGVNKTSKDLQAELKQVNALLKFDPTNTELLAQKQKLLAQDITNTKGKLETLKTAESQAQEQFKKGKISEEQYRALEREIVSTESKLKGLETQAKKVNGALTSDQAVSNLKNMGKAVAVTAEAAVVAFGAMAVAELNNADVVQKTADVYGLTAERVQELQYVGTKLDVDLETITKSQSMLTKAMFAAKDGTGAQSDAFKELGISVTNSDGSLRSSQDVMAESFAALGKMTNETERDALAQKLFGKSAMELNPLIKASAGEIANLTEEAHKTGAVLSNESVAGLDAFGDSIDAAKVSVMGIVGEALSKLMPYINDLIKGLTELPKWIEKNQTLVTIIAIAVGALVLAFLAFNIEAAFTVSALTGMSAAGTFFAGVMAFVNSTMFMPIMAIAALIAIGVLLWKNWDVISAKAKDIFGGIGKFIGGIMGGITGGFKSMANGSIDALNALIRGINKLKFDVPSWVPFLGGLKFGFSIPTIPRFDVGTRYLNQDMLIQAHQGEMIVPKNQNPYANSGGQIMPNQNVEFDYDKLIKALEKGHFIAVIARDSVVKEIDRRVLALDNT